MEIRFNWPDSIPEDQIDKEFIQGMLDRMAFGFHNYGHMRRRHDRPDNIKNMLIRMIKYAGFSRVWDSIEQLKKVATNLTGTGNTEFLMDEANYAMMEYAVPSHPEAHFRATESHESPGSHVSGRIVRNKSELTQVPDMKRPKEGD